MYENVNVEFDAGIVTITLNRPEKLNALAGHMRRDLAEALEHASSDPSARVVADAELPAETRRLAERLRDAPPAAVAAAKRAVYMSEHESLERMLQYETEAQLQCFQSREARERVRAFLERRAPRAAKP